MWRCFPTSCFRVCCSCNNSNNNKSSSASLSLVWVPDVPSTTFWSDDLLHQSPSGPSTKCPLTSNADASCKMMCARDGCSSSSAAGRGGSHRGRWCRPRKPRCNLKVTSQNTNRRIRVRRKSSPKNCTYEESKQKDKTNQTNVLWPVLLLS